MNLQNGACYKNADGIAVRCQLEGDGFFHVYDADGSEVDKIPQRTTVSAGSVDGEGERSEHDEEHATHVNGWNPISNADFRATATEPGKKRKKKGSASTNLIGGKQDPK